MKFGVRLATFAFTIILSLIAFTCAAIKFPVMMRDLLVKVQNVRDGLLQMNLSHNYEAWVSNMFAPNLIVLMGFAIAVQLLLGGGNALLKFLWGEADAGNASPLPVPRMPSWGWG